MSGKNVLIKGCPIHLPNDVYEGKGDFYISYNDYDTSIYGSDTTALVIGNMEQILNGNHIANYKNLSLTDCLTYFKNNSGLINKYSEKL